MNVLTTTYELEIIHSAIEINRIRSNSSKWNCKIELEMTKETYGNCTEIIQSEWNDHILKRYF